MKRCDEARRVVAPYREVHMKEFKTYKSRKPGGLRITITANQVEPGEREKAIWIGRQMYTELIKENRRRRHRGDSAIMGLIEVVLR